MRQLPNQNQQLKNKPMKDLIKKYSELQNSYDKVLMEIGILTAQYFGKDRTDLTTLTNVKIEVLKKIEIELREIEKKIAENG